MVNFFLRWNGRRLDFDGAYGAQCVDVIKQYFQDVLKLPPYTGDAIDYWDSPPLGFIKIPKTLFNHPEPGDIIIWNTLPYGHIAICNWWRWFDLGVFEQNNPLGSPCRYGTHSYRDIVGWIRPVKKVIEVAFVGGNPDLFIQKVHEYTDGTLELRVNRYSRDIGPINLDEGQKIIDELNLKEKFVFLHCGNTAYEVASFYPARNTAFCTIPYFSPDTVRVHAFLHLLRKYINFNKLGPYIEDVERYPTSWSDMANFNNEGWKFKEQYEQLKSYLPRL